MPETLVKVWCEILNDFEQNPCISIPRRYFDEINEEIEQYSLHASGDASKKAFCSVIYLVIKIASGYHYTLVTSKSRVVPQKNVSSKIGTYCRFNLNQAFGQFEAFS